MTHVLSETGAGAPAGFSFPLFLTVGHMVFSFVVLAPVMAFQPFASLHHATLRKQWKGLVCIGGFMALNIALNNLSLVDITLSLNQVIRCVAGSRKSCMVPLGQCDVAGLACGA